jgi:hypothetical protein
VSRGIFGKVNLEEKLASFGNILRRKAHLPIYLAE